MVCLARILTSIIYTLKNMRYPRSSTVLYYVYKGQFLFIRLNWARTFGISSLFFFFSLAFFLLCDRHYSCLMHVSLYVRPKRVFMHNYRGALAFTSTTHKYRMRIFYYIIVLRRWPTVIIVILYGRFPVPMKKKKKKFSIVVPRSFVGTVASGRPKTHNRRQFFCQNPTVLFYYVPAFVVWYIWKNIQKQ